MLFSGIIGHGEIIKSLTSAVTEKKLGHAYLFAGPAGVGKKTIAKAFIKVLLCQGQGIIANCTCDSCLKLAAGAHPDFYEIAPTGNTIKIDQLRELQHMAYFRPLMGESKVFFFPDAEQLTEAAANSFLKLLEEPPPGVIFIFTAVRLENILPTIRSRCQVYNLFPVPVPEIAAWLGTKGLPTPEALLRAKTCQGLPGLALEQRTGLEKRINFKDLIALDLYGLLRLSNELEKKERREVVELVQAWEAEARQELLEVSNKGTQTAIPAIQRMVDILERIAKVKVMIESNVQSRLVLDQFFTALKITSDNR